jgi:methylthioribulose-1-phosphate dehydratase
MTADGSPPDLRSTKELLCELLRLFYQLGWCTGTGGGISIKSGNRYLVAPSGVAKERVRPEDLFELNTDFQVANPESTAHLKCSECSPLFEAIYRRCAAGAVIHSHSVPLVLATRRVPKGVREVAWERLEMIKGIRGCSYPNRHAVPLIDNTPREAELLNSLEQALVELPPNAHAVFVRDHGAYVWGRDAMEAKRHAEVYDWLCQFAHAEAQER